MDFSGHFGGTELVCPRRLVRDGGVGQGMQKTCWCLSSIAEKSKAGTFKETQGAYGQPTYFGPWCTKAFFLAGGAGESEGDIY